MPVVRESRLQERVSKFTPKKIDDIDSSSLYYKHITIIMMIVKVPQFRASL